MSGNPFRKQQAAEAPKSKGKTKKVTFVSPIASPQDEPSHPRFPALEELEDVPKSPPPRGLTEEPEAIDTRALLRGDVTAGGAIDLKANEREEAAAAAIAARQTASPVPSDFQLGQPPGGRKGPPANPFARTLASMEAEASAGKLNYDASKQKQLMDVDSFKRMLLTGTADTPPTAGVNTGNSTDSSYASKLSGSEQEREARPGSPAFSISSLEDASSEDESGSEAEATTARGATTEAKTDSAQAQQGPQTVSFDDFDDEALQPSRMDAELPTPASPRAAERKPTLPPPPPTSRRVGQGRRLTLNTDVDDPDTTTSSRPKPPPPRAPAPRQTSREAKSRASSDSTRTASSDTVPTVDDTEAKTKPPPPPSRKQVRRMSSSGSGIAPRRASPGVAGSTPPPPPPRRSEAKRSSLEGGRPSGDNHSIGTDRRSSIGSLERTVEEDPEEEKPPVGREDMLADLDAFQKEVDALRARALKGA